MKIFGLTLLLILGISKISFNQNFEGVIHGVTKYVSKIDSVSAEELFGQKISLDVTYIKDGFFKVKSSTDFMRMMLWRSADTTLYWFNKTSEDTLWYDKTYSHPDEFNDHYIVEKVDSVAGYLCDALVIRRDDGGTMTYYYSSKLALDPEYYKGSTNSAKYDVMKKIKSIYLKLVIDTSYGVVESRAMSVEWKKLPDAFFEVPEDAVLKKAIY
jgi:hypothetical protein